MNEAIRAAERVYEWTVKLHTLGFSHEEISLCRQEARRIFPSWRTDELMAWICAQAAINSLSRDSLGFQRLYFDGQGKVIFGG